MDRAFTEDSDFDRLDEPKPGEWLYRFRESAQTFDDYVRSNPPGTTRTRRNIVLRPLGPFEPELKNFLDGIREYCELYFDRTTQVGSPLALTGLHPRQRLEEGRHWVQYLTTELLERVLEPELPKDAICLMGIILYDLYPNADWNYVFGQASLAGRVGVYSLVRYFPTFWAEEETVERRHLGFQRSLKVLTHETGHMLGLTHCVFYKCGMNGSNSLEELDRRPAEVCPVCLRKLQWNLGFDPLSRYERLEEFYRRNGMQKEAEWEKRHAALLKTPASSTESSQRVRGSR